MVDAEELDPLKRGSARIKKPIHARKAPVNLRWISALVVVVLFLIGLATSASFSTPAEDAFDDAYSTSSDDELQPEYETARWTPLHANASDLAAFDAADETGLFIHDLRQKGYTFEGNFIQLSVDSEVPAKIPCRPKACTKPKVLLKKPVKVSVALASFPGSGNTWVRWMLTQGSRIETTSVYCDRKLATGGFPFTCSRGKRIQNRVIATKTHWPAFGGSTFSRANFHPPDAGIFLLRAPFDAILAAYTIHAGHELKIGDNHVSSLPPSYYRGKKFNAGVKSGVKRWVRHMDEITDRSAEATPLDPKAGSHVPLLLVYYENLVQAPFPELKRVFYYLKHVLGFEDLVPSVNDAATCALYNLDGQEHRSHGSKAKKWFTDAQIAMVCDKTRAYWNEDVWGKCDGTLQRDRKDAPEKQHVDLVRQLC